MASERSTERIIDLLYGELSPEEEAEVREELESSAPLRAELDGLESLLGQVREAMPAEEVSETVHASILDAARTAARNQPSDVPARRGPADREGRSAWRRAASGQKSQIALVAAVLIAGVFVVKFLDRDMHPTMAPASDISAVQEPAPPAPMEEAQKPAAVEEEIVEENEGMGELPDPTAAAAVPEPTTEVLGSETKGLADALNSQQAERKEDRSDIAPPAKKRAKAAGTRSARPAEAPRRKQTAKPSSGQTQNIMGDKDLKRPDTVDDESEKEAPMVELKASEDSAFAKQEQAAPSSPAPSGPSDYGSAAAAEAEPEPAQREYRPESGTISAVEQRARVNDYNGTIAAADQFLQGNSGSATERARALQLKADSLTKLGRYAEADRVYEGIQKNYPTYQTSAINAARASVQERLRKTPSRRKRSAPKSKKAVDSTYDVQSLD